MLDFRYHDHQDAVSIRTLLLDLHDEVYAGSSDPLAPRAAFADILEHWSTSPGFVCVVARATADGAPVGYIYGAPLTPGTGWWDAVRPAPPADFIRETGGRTFAVSELLVRAPWRGTGAARAMHNVLLHERPEERSTLLVHADHVGVIRTYQQWGYQIVGDAHPFPEAPPLHVMLRRSVGHTPAASVRSS